MRQIVLDTETTGLEPGEGHRIIEIGCLELDNRRPTGRKLHEYLQPDREIDAGAIEIHGITNEFLADKPRFADVVGEFIEFVRGAELIIHNAPFDVGFLNHELRLLGDAAPVTELAEACTVLDSLVMARRMHPGTRNSLDALCKRYEIDASGRTLHGALLDAELLADVYLAMTGGQVALGLDAGGEGGAEAGAPVRAQRSGKPLPVIEPDADEQAAHEALLRTLDESAGGACRWRATTS
ncbi:MULTISPECIES: DNA polymerase III subunit epsilon [unclassified Thioalkalivibrio]|uniref:DNA polymerase III subunit epsilon n=1 Tax=unclassified Thioalkalivibrio TaxID=2621013 RepID=UPI00037AD337|nr:MULTISPECIES: DNA polymerase III subunit epsilon [unclassified Thioalkalivibrio]